MPIDNAQSSLRLIPLSQVIARVGYERTTIYALIKEGRFPRPVRAGKGRSSRWVLSEVEKHIADAIAGRDALADTNCHVSAPSQ